MPTNYYEELNLDDTKTVEEINAELNNLERIWRRRELNSPEKAHKMLVLLDEARGVFRSESLRLEYDKELSKIPDDPAPNMDAERAANYLRWKEQAETFFYKNHQDELAREALHKAAQYKSPDMLDEDFSLLSSFIATSFGDTDTALSAINEAILANPNKGLYHLQKGEIYATLYDDAVRNNNPPDILMSYLEKAKAEHEEALKLYKSKGDIQGQITCFEFLAAAYAEVYNSDLKRAEEYARQALSLQPNNSDMQTLLQTIQQEKEVFQPYQGAGHPSSSSGKGCYIATAVYGSYNCPEVWTLRRYRDYKLASTWGGRIFIKLYYKFSPLLIRCFGHSEWFVIFWRRYLDKMVVHLRKCGFSADRYND